MPWWKGEPKDQETREKISKALKGKEKTKEHRDAISKGVRRWWSWRKGEDDEREGGDDDEGLRTPPSRIISSRSSP